MPYDSIPVLAYHQIGKNSRISFDDFSGQMRYLYENGYKSVTLDEFYSYISSNKKINEKRVLITFDDGFSDNFVLAYPVLKKYGFNAVIFLITSRIKDSDLIRPNYDDYECGKVSLEELYETNISKVANAGGVKGNTDDFLTKGEIKKMSEDGIIEFESHTHSHARYFSDDNIVDFFNPGSPWHVLFETDGKPDYGIPVYNMGFALLNRRFFDDKGLRTHLKEFVDKNGKKEFFKENDWRKKLSEIVKTYKKGHKLNERYEEENEYERRVTNDLVTSKEIIKRITGRDSEFLCWPWGEYNESATRIAKKCGFKGIFSLKRGANIPGGDPFNIRRLEVKPKDITWFKKRVNTYSSAFRSMLYGLVRS